MNSVLQWTGNPLLFQSLPDDVLLVHYQQRIGFCSAWSFSIDLLEDLFFVRYCNQPEQRIRATENKHVSVLLQHHPVPGSLEVQTVFSFRNLQSSIFSESMRRDVAVFS